MAQTDLPDSEFPNSRLNVRETVSVANVLIGVILCILVLAIVRGVLLSFNQTDLFFDEAQYWSWGLELEAGYFSKPPVLSWVIRGVTEICGTGEACVRFTSVLLYSVTAFIVALLALALGEGRVSRVSGLWAALFVATIPGISFATRLVSTDAALLVFWALAMLFLTRLAKRRSVLDAIGLGVAFGLGFLSKYAMIFLLPCASIWMIFSVHGRAALLSRYSIITGIVAGLTLLPNILWNARNDWITFRHTKDNGNWQGFNIHWDNMLEFTGAQIGIIGPILALVLAIAIWKRRSYWDWTYTFCLCFSLPVLLIILVQAGISRAHANWAAVAFVPLTVMAALIIVRWRAKGLALSAMALHFLVIAALGFVDVNARSLLDDAPGRALKRLFGWSEMFAELQPVIVNHKIATVIAFDRESAAQAFYYLKDLDVEIRVWQGGEIPGHHYELAYAISDDDQGPFLILDRCAGARVGVTSGTIVSRVNAQLIRKMNYSISDTIKVGRAPSC